MADKYFQPGATNLAGATWATSRGGTYNASLATGDDAYILEGSQTITTGHTTDINSLTVGPQFQGALGTGSTSITLANDADGTTTIAGGTYANITSDGSNAIKTLNVEASIRVDVAGSSSIATVNVYRGSVEIGAGCDVSSIFRIFGGQCTLLVDGDTVPTAFVLGGSLTSYRSLDTVNQGGGVCILEDTAASGTATNVFGGRFNMRGDGTIAALNLYTRGTFTVRGAVDTPTITTANLYGGNYLPNWQNIEVTAGTTNNFGNVVIGRDSSGAGDISSGA